ncbi:MAG: RagB/SusD family nutrient uptake outer membrane protein [Gemmatimonadetes bacterium]|nr:RagB/SusD family nutrient uptake outer membrane protein [Gemmatimonadota bacterium]
MTALMTRRAFRRRITRVGTLAVTALGLACDSLLSVENPGRVEEAALGDPAIMPILSAAALQTAQCAFAEFAATGGVLSGEYWSANGFVNNHIWEWRGVVEIKGSPGGCNNGRATTSLGFYTPAQQARFQLDDLAKRLADFTDAQVPNRQRMLAEAAAYSGYMHTLLGEGMCEMAIDNGPSMTPQQVWAIAETKFATALQIATAINDASLRNMATVGRARVRLDLGNLTGAAADAALVPTGFVRNAEFSETTPARENHLYNLTVRNDFLSVAPAYRGLTVNGVADPRVRANDMRRVGPDNSTPIWQQQKFTGSGGASLPIASYAEAQLILAEAVGGQAAIDAINRVRALSNIAPMPTPPAGTNITDLVIEERRRQLFSEGHRYVDMLRKRIPFQSGVNRKGQTYSTLTCIPLPDVETRNNPNFKNG